MKAEGLQRKRCFATLPDESSNSQSHLSGPEKNETHSEISSNEIQGQLIAGRWTLQVKFSMNAIWSLLHAFPK